MALGGSTVAVVVPRIAQLGYKFVQLKPKVVQVEGSWGKLVPKSVLGPSLVHPWCILGASLIPYWFLVGASLRVGTSIKENRQTSMEVGTSNKENHRESRNIYLRRSARQAKIIEWRLGRASK